MANVNKADFYFGAMLSVMITRGVQKPALFEESDNKRIYTFSKYRCQARLNYKLMIGTLRQLLMFNTQEDRGGK